MDDRQAQLIGAAEALRTWVYTQRASWTDGASAGFSNLRTPAFSQGSAALAESAGAVAVVADDPLAVPFERPIAPPGRSFDVTGIARSVLKSLATIASLGASVPRRVLRIGLAFAVLAGVVWTAAAYWPMWSGAVKVQLAAAGERLTVFDRAVPPAAATVTKNIPPERAGTRRTGRVHVDSNPVGARVEVDGRDRGVTPLTLSDLSVGSHTIVLRGEEGSVQRTIAVTADKMTQVNEAIYSGWLHVSSPIELQISDGTRTIHLDDSNQVLLPPGPHDVRFENRLFGFVDVQKIEVRPGDTTSVSVQPPTSKLSVTASTPAEVLVDGLVVGGTPLTDYALDVGTREIVVRNAVGAERRAMTTITVAPTHLDIDFSKP